MTNRDSAARWFISISRKLFRVAPIEMSATMFATLLLQVAKLLAMLLPIKIIIIMAGGSVPRYFPPFLNAYPTLDLVVGMTGLALGCYVGGFGLQQVISRLTETGAEKLARHNAKLTMFAGQEAFAKETYRQLSASLAGLLFATLASIVVIVIYPRLAGVVAVMGGVVTATIFAVVLAAAKKKQRPPMRRLLKVGPQVVFLGAFAFLVAEFLYGALPNPFIALISLILSRQLLMKGTAGGKGLAVLAKQRPKIDATIFRNHGLDPDRGPRRPGLLDMLTERELPLWSRRALAELVGAEARPDTVSLFHYSGAAAATLNATDDRSGNRWALRIHAQSSAQSCRRQTDLFEAVGTGKGLLPAWLGSTDVGPFGVEVFAEGFDEPAPDDKPPPPQLVETLWRMPVPTRLRARFLRSHRPRHQRLDGPALADFEGIAHLFAFKDEIPRFRALVAPALSQRLDAVPLVFENPAGPGSLAMQGGRLVISNWSQWSLAPVGTGLPIRSLRADSLAAALAEAAGKNPALADTTPEEVQLAALAGNLFVQLRRRQWLDASRTMRVLGAMVLDGTPFDASLLKDAGPDVPDEDGAAPAGGDEEDEEEAA